MKKQDTKKTTAFAFTLLVFLFVLLSAQWASSPQQATEEAKKNVKELLSNMGICPYPEKEELEDSVLDPKFMRGLTLSEADINQDFSNLDDLKWLESIAKKSKVFLFGEWHYFQVIHHLRNRILFALNTFDSYPLVIEEKQYSISGYLDYYIGIEDDQEAQTFYQDVIYDLVNEEEGFIFLEHLRRWNHMFPEKRIHYGASDVEHDYTSTLRRVIVPYFKKADPAFDIDFDNFSFLDLEALIPDLQKRLKTAKAKNIIGEFPFLTPQYIECVIENLRSLFLCYRYEFNYYRQKAMIRNLTDSRFFGKYFRKGKVMVYGGGFHTTTHFPYPEGGNFYREGSYLTYDFGPTKGKTFSLMVQGIAYKFGSMADVDMKNTLHHGSGYRNYVQSFQGAYKQKLVSPEDHYYFSRKLDDWDKFTFSVAYDYDHKPLLIQKIDWEGLLAKAKATSKDLYGTIRSTKDFYDRYDLYLLVFRSSITHVKMKKDKSEYPFPSN